MKQGVLRPPECGESVNRERDKPGGKTDLRRKGEKVTGDQFIPLFFYFQGSNWIKKDALEGSWSTLNQTGVSSVKGS
jgi:hypothetical protein